jgi:hypothetical protein
VYIKTSGLLKSWSQIHEHKILLKFLGIILRVLRLEVSVYNVYITNQFQTTFAQGEGRVKIVTVNSRSKTLKTFCPNDVQEFGLWLPRLEFLHTLRHSEGRSRGPTGQCSATNYIFLAALSVCQEGSIGRTF